VSKQNWQDPQNPGRRWIGVVPNEAINLGMLLLLIAIAIAAVAATVAIAVAVATAVAVAAVAAVACPMPARQFRPEVPPLWHPEEVVLLPSMSAVSRLVKR
jgi:hypothetical protein